MLLSNERASFWVNDRSAAVNHNDTAAGPRPPFQRKVLPIGSSIQEAGGSRRAQHDLLLLLSLSSALGATASRSSIGPCAVRNIGSSPPSTGPSPSMSRASFNA